MKQQEWYKKSSDPYEYKDNVNSEIGRDRNYLYTQNKHNTKDMRPTVCIFWAQYNYKV